MWVSQQQEGKDPWDRSRHQKPPNLDDMLAKWFKGLQQKAGPGASNSSGGNVIGLGILAAALIGLWVISGIYIISPAEQGVILRFGRYHQTVGMGPHWIPRLIDQVIKVNVEKISTLPYQSDMLTKDENIVNAELSIQYRIADPKSYLFNVVSPVDSLQQATASALRQVVGESTLATEPSILTTGRDAARIDIEKQLNSIMDRYQTGIEITDVKLQNVRPPDQVIPAFDDAIKAREDEQRFINQARAYSEKVVPIANGQAMRITQAANAYKQQVVLDANAGTAKFLALLPAHQRAPEVTEKRLYLSALEKLYASTDKLFMDTKANPLMMLPFEKLLKQSPSAS